MVNISLSNLIDGTTISSLGTINICCLHDGLSPLLLSLSLCFRLLFSERIN
jgi:hypothetical protein